MNKELSVINFSSFNKSWKGFSLDIEKVQLNIFHQMQDYIIIHQIFFSLSQHYFLHQYLYDLDSLHFYLHSKIQ